MQVRHSPFAEWVLIYYDPEKISEKTLLTLARTKGCKNAQIDRPKEITAGKTKIQVLNPVLTPGDSLIISIDSSEKVTPEFTLPKGMTLKKGQPTSIEGKTLIYLDTADSIGSGEKKMSVKLNGETVNLKYDVVKEVR